MPRFCKQADLELALGGAEQLAQLLSKNGGTQPDAALVARVLDDASAEMASYIDVVVDLATLSEPYPPILVTKTAEAATYYAWRMGAYGQAIPESVSQAHDKAIAWAQDVGNKRASLGVVAKPGLNQPVGVVDHDKLGAGISVTAFKKGFR